MKERLQSVPEDFDDFADDFDDNLLQQIEEAEQSYAKDKSDTELEEEAMEEDPQNQPQDPKFSAVLKQCFGYSKFRPMQWRIIDSVLNEKKDNCVVMATGYGKSLCYQFPSVFTGRSTVVISPLISLMQDQVLGLQAMNIEACFLGSAQENMGQVKRDMLRFVPDKLQVSTEKVYGAAQKACMVQNWASNGVLKQRVKMRRQIEEAEQSYAKDKSDTELEEEAMEEDPQNQPQDPKFSAVLKQCFGYSKFRPMQWRIIDSVLNEKKDNCVVMATGYGKSLCYQFPSVFTGRSTVVISPLISLMQDQVLGLQAMNIEACFLGSAQENMGQVKRDMLRGKYRVVYITPEFASKASNLLQDLHSKVGIDLIAIDEAHCVSQWGHDFRSAYRSLGRIRDMLSKVPIVALTATATPEVRKDICKSLQLRNPVLTCTGFDRPNLFLSASKKSKNMAQDLRSMMTKQDNTYVFDGPTIIYCLTKKATMGVTYTLQASGVDCLPYHAGLSQEARKDAHQRFVNDKIQVIVATVAFGMGIDKPDVRRVIHYGAPKDIESYYREMGRAGRDGMPGECHVFFANKDFLTCMYFIKHIKNATFKAHKLKMLAKMKQYLTLPSCRRRAILSHFEKKEVSDVGGTNNCCDNCRKRIELGKRQNYYGASHQLQDPNKPVDFSKEAFSLLGTIEATAESQQALVMLSRTQRVSYVMFEQQGKSLEEVASLRGLEVSTVVTHLCEGLRVGLDIDTAKLGMTDKIRELVTQAVRAPPVSSDITRMRKIKDQLPRHVDWHHLKVVLALLEGEHGVTVLPTGQRILHGATASGVPPHETGASVTVINNNNITTPRKLSSTHSTVTTGQTPSSSVQVHSRNSPFSSSFHSRISSMQEQTFSQSDSQGQLQSSKRKLPSWISGGPAPKRSKKMKW